MKTATTRAGDFTFGVFGLLNGRAIGIGREMVMGSGRQNAGGTELRLASCGLGARSNEVVFTNGRLDGA